MKDGISREEQINLIHQANYWQAQHAQLKQKNRVLEQARHATSRNYGTPVANIHSPTQRMGDALVALLR